MADGGKSFDAALAKESLLERAVKSFTEPKYLLLRKPNPMPDLRFGDADVLLYRAAISFEST